MKKQQFEVIIASLKSAEKEMGHKYSKHRINTVIACIEAGFVENLLNWPILQNAINLLAPFVKSETIKKAIRLLQEGLSEYKKR